eukprot:sb/3472742/
MLTNILHLLQLRKKEERENTLNQLTKKPYTLYRQTQFLTYFIAQLHEADTCLVRSCLVALTQSEHIVRESKWGVAGPDMSTVNSKTARSMPMSCKTIKCFKKDALHHTQKQNLSIQIYMSHKSHVPITASISYPHCSGPQQLSYFAETVQHSADREHIFSG